MDQAAEESDKQITLLTNKVANRGRAEAKGEMTLEILTSLGRHVNHVLPEGIEGTYAAVKEAVAEGRHIVAVGGNGCIHHVDQGCAPKTPPLGFIPGGRGIAFA